MRIKKIVLGVGVAAITGGAVASGIYYFATRDPVAIQVDPRLYDDYVGYYVSGMVFTCGARASGILLGGVSRGLGGDVLGY